MRAYNFSRAIVEVRSEDGEKLYKAFRSPKVAAKETGFDIDKIRDACFRQKIYKGFLWKYRGMEVVRNESGTIS